MLLNIVGRVTDFTIYCHTKIAFQGLVSVSNILSQNNQYNKYMKYKNFKNNFGILILIQAMAVLL